MALRNPQTRLDELYAAYDNLIAGKIQSYTLGDRSVSLLDLKPLLDAIAAQEIVVAQLNGGRVLADLGGPAAGSWPR